MGKLNIHNVALAASATAPEQYPKAELPEIALAGRSNVGKSSFINKLLNRKNLAHTSSVPGKTATINFYNIDNSMFFVDLPGYGYAQRAKSEIKKWGKMIETYLFGRAQLSATFLIVDARHTPTDNDILMLNWIKNRHGKAVVVATKIDKLKKSELQEKIENIRETLSLGDEDELIPFSAVKGNGVREAWSAVSAVAGVTMPKGI